MQFRLASTAANAVNITLSDPSTWYQCEVVFTEPLAPVRPVDDPAPAEGPEPPLRRLAREGRIRKKRVPDLNVYFGTVAQKMQEEKAARYTHASVSVAIQQAWKLRKQWSSLHYLKPKATRSVITMQEVTSNGEEAPVSSTTDAATAATVTGGRR
ncbi:hypothetical protein MMC22_004910 [Lobaria immixta]|nr:hypothetical protein [Lobaria immixta]